MPEEKNIKNENTATSGDRCEKKEKKQFGFQELLSYIPTPALICFALLLLSIVIYAVLIISPEFADFFNTNIASYFRMVLAKISGIVSFSIAETLIYLLIPILAVVLIKAIGYTKKDEFKKAIRTMVSMISILSIMLSSFVFTHASGYRGSSLDKRLGIEKSAVSAEELKTVANIIAGKLNEESKNIEYIHGSFSVMPYSFDELNDKINEAYSKVCDKYDFILDFTSKVKPVVGSEILSHAHILGIYTYFTGEANVNVAFPDYTLPFTVAHEMSHQRGFSREDEANLMAYLVCLESDDPYVRYSGYYNMLEYLMNPLYSADPEAYSELYYSLEDNIIIEMKAYREFFKKYEDTVVSNVSGSINDKFLQSQGQSAGRKSYGLVVDLVVAYYKYLPAPIN